MIKIAIQAGGKDQREMNLSQAEYIIGRDDACDITLKGSKVSRRHGRIYRSADSFLVEDLGSANGILVNKTKLSSPTKLNKGDIVFVGEYKITVLNDSTIEQAKYILVGRSAPCANQTFPLPQGIIDLGRVGSNALAIDHASISRHHARISCNNQVVVLEDNGSSNGTWVNEKRLSAPQELRHGDIIRLGKVQFLFSERLQSESAPTQAYQKPFISFKAIMISCLVVLISIASFAAYHTFFAKKQASQEKLSLYEQALASQIAQAQAFASEEDWSGALNIYKNILTQDPLNPEAKKHVYSLKKFIEARDLLTIGLKLFDEGKVLKAETLLKVIPEGTPYDDALKLLQGNIQTKKELTLQLTSEEVEKQIRDAYPDKQVRIAVDRYRENKLGEAIKHVVKHMQRAGASRLHRTLLKTREYHRSAMTHETNKAYHLAAGSLQSILSLDRELIPLNSQNLFRKDILQQLSNNLLAAGEEAWLSNAYEQAYITWLKGFNAMPTDKRYDEKFRLLENVAKNKLSSISPAKENLQEEDCEILKQVKSFTLPRTFYYRKAASKLGLCKSTALPKSP